jgi:hypothetical protein
MKKFFLFAWGILFSVNIFCQTSVENKKDSENLLSPPRIDKRVELLSIVFRLAGLPEYNQNNFKIYTDAIHNHFDKYKGHPAVLFARKMADSNGVGFDAPMALAIHLEQPPALNQLFPFSETAPEPRWGKKNAEEFVALLKRFYVDAECDKFFKEQASLYKTVEERFKIVFDALDVSWYKQFYGALPSGKLHIFIGISNGGCNYGPNVIYPDGRKDAFAIMGTWSIDDKGMPKYSAGYYLSTLVHEFNHSFINHLNENNINALEEPGKIIFGPLQNIMQSQAYTTPLYMLNEALVRAGVVRYIIKHNPDTKAAEREIKAQTSNGFIWIRELVDLLGVYENSRDKYPALESFMPNIIEFYNNTAKNLNNYLVQCGHVKSVEPFANNSNDVSPDLKEMKIIFDKPLFNEDIADLRGIWGEDNLPIVKNGARFTDNNMAVILSIVLKPGTKYEFAISGPAFSTADGFPLLFYPIEFKTK